MSMAYTAENWPITAAMLPFPGTNAQGSHINDADSSVWARALTEVKEAGFTNADLTDSWVRPGDLSRERLAEFKQTAEGVGIGIPAISAIRRSVIDEGNWEANLAYSHRTIDAAAELGCEVVSFGLHQAITQEQQKQLWFWTVDGHKDPSGDKETWNDAVSRLRELGRHAAEVGILLSLEMYEDTYLGTADSSVRLVQDILSVGFQGILCTEHYGGDGLSVTASNQDYLRRHVLPKTEGYALGKSQVTQGRQQPTAELAGV